MTQKEIETNDIIAIVRGAYDAYVTKDRAAIERVLAPDFHFTSPVDNRIDRETYFARCWPNSAQIADFKFINLVVDRDRMFVTYEGHRANRQVFRNTEIVTLREKQIIEVEVYFGWSIPHEAQPGGFLDKQ